MPNTLWTTPDGSRYFLIPDDRTMESGSLRIKSLVGTLVSISPDWVASFEFTEEQARRIAKDQLGQTLDELKKGIDEQLADLRWQLDEKNLTPITDKTTVTPNAVPALFELLKKLPGVIRNSISGEEARVESAKSAMIDLQKQLKEAGIDLDDQLENFPDRLVEVRKNFEQRRASNPSSSDGNPSD